MSCLSFQNLASKILLSMAIVLMALITTVSWYTEFFLSSVFRADSFVWIRLCKDSKNVSNVCWDVISVVSSCSMICWSARSCHMTSNAANNSHNSGKKVSWHWRICLSTVAYFLSWVMAVSTWYNITMPFNLRAVNWSAMRTAAVADALNASESFMNTLSGTLNFIVSNVNGKISFFNLRIPRSLEYWKLL